MSRTYLKEINFFEVYNYSFINEKQAEYLGFKSKGLIELENPISIEQKYLRPSLIPGLIKNFKENSKRIGLEKEIKIFEIGKVFSAEKSKVIEKKVLTALIFNKDIDGFHQLKGDCDCLLEKLGISDVWYDDFKMKPEFSIWDLSKSAEIKSGKGPNSKIGFLGEIFPKVFVFVFDLEKIIRLSSEECSFRPISSFPAAIRDIAVLVPKKTKVEDVLNVINVAGKSLIQDVDLFDIYEGKELLEDRKNLAFHIIYQSEKRTLDSKEINKIHQKIFKAIEENPEWQIRK